MSQTEQSPSKRRPHFQGVVLQPKFVDVGHGLVLPLRKSKSLIHPYKSNETPGSEWTQQTNFQTITDSTDSVDKGL